MDKIRRAGLETLLACAVSIAVVGCSALPAAIPVIVVSSTPLPSATVPPPTATPAIPTPDISATPEASETPAASGQRLRLTNTGSTDIHDLVVQFPGGRVEFGELAAGQTSEYREVPGGVYRYAAYEFDLNDETIQQPVIDWVGETRMEGTAFTYSINLSQPDGGRNWIELTGVTRDE